MTNPEPGLDTTYSQFRCAEIKQVPILRIFGSTPEGNLLTDLYRDVFFQLICLLKRTKNLFARA
jgi:hypothetical protein